MTTMPAVVRNRIAGQQTPHDSGNGGFAGSQQKMRMIGNQRLARTKGFGVGDNVIDSVNEVFPVGIIIENFPALDSPNDDMLQGTGGIDSGFAWHNAFIPQKS